MALSKEEILEYVKATRRFVNELINFFKKKSIINYVNV